MFNSAIPEAAIGIVFIYLVLSLMSAAFRTGITCDRSTNCPQRKKA